jgi:hypothetical protein
MIAVKPAEEGEIRFGRLVVVQGVFDEKYSNLAAETRPVGSRINFPKPDSSGSWTRFADKYFEQRLLTALVGANQGGDLPLLDL